MDIDKKIEQLEVKNAYLEDYIEKLNSVIIEQNKVIAELKKAVEGIENRLNTETDENPPHEKPPHY